MNKAIKILFSICTIIFCILVLPYCFESKNQKQLNPVEADNPKEVLWQSVMPEATNEEQVSIPHVHTAQVTNDEQPIYISSSSSIQHQQITTKNYNTATDTIYTYTIAETALLTITVRTLQNEAQFIFLTLENSDNTPVTVDVFQAAEQVERYRLSRFDRYTLKRGEVDSPSYDLATMPTGVLQIVQKNGDVLERVVGQAYRSKPLSLSYSDGSKSVTRELFSEEESYSHFVVNEKFYMFHRLASSGHDVVDSWYVQATTPLFTSDQALEAWIQETAIHYRKRNSWYTAQGPYNKMALTIEPMPASHKGYGRNLLLVKEDRALELFAQQGDFYFETIVQNALANLDIFKGDDAFWYTEITSTYLKDLYNFTAPFVDTRFNEQIALFYMRASELLELQDGLEPLYNYADFLVSQVQSGNIISVADDAYYLPDYYPVNNTVKTHSSMNHMLGGIAVLLHAYEKIGDETYLTVAKAQMNAIALHETDWTRPNQDIWYKVNPDLTFVGTDYVHLTLEDLTYVYHLWSNIDTQYLPLLERLIASKAQFLMNEDKGYTGKIQTNLQRIDLLKYLPPQ